MSLDLGAKLSGNAHDPFAADASEGSGGSKKDETIHIRIQQRNGRKTLTTVQGVHVRFDLKKIVKACKKVFACNGTVVEHPEYGEIIQLQGDQRNHIKEFLIKTEVALAQHVKVHGF